MQFIIQRYFILHRTMECYLLYIFINLLFIIIKIRTDWKI